MTPGPLSCAVAFLDSCARLEHDIFLLVPVEAEAVYIVRACSSRQIFHVRHILPDTLQTMTAIVLTLLRIGPAGRRQGETTARAALPLFQKVFGKDHEHTLYAASQLGAILRQRGGCKECEGFAEYTPAQPAYRAESEAILKATLEAQTKLLGADHESTVCTTARLRCLLNCPGR